MQANLQESIDHVYRDIKRQNEEERGGGRVGVLLNETLKRVD